MKVDKILVRPTTKDLAEAAGVSLATVDRVLNDRPNVSKKARVRVQDAIERLGFVRNLAAVNLARGQLFKYQFILPDVGDQYLDEVQRRIGEAQAALRGEPIGIDVVQLDMSDPHQLADHLTALKPGEINGLAIQTLETPPVRDALARLQERGVHVVEMLSGIKLETNLDFVGVDNFAAGATAARLMGRFSQKQPGKVMVIADTMQALDSIQRRHGFDSLINDAFSHLTCLPTLETYNNVERAKSIIRNQFEANDTISGIYCLSSEARIPVELASKIADLTDLTVIVHERTPFTETALRSGLVDAAIGQNPGHAVRSAIRILRARSENREGVKEQDKIRIEVLLPDNL